MVSSQHIRFKSPRAHILINYRWKYPRCCNSYTYGVYGINRTILTSRLIEKSKWSSKEFEAESYRILQGSKGWIRWYKRITHHLTDWIDAKLNNLRIVAKGRDKEWTIAINSGKGWICKGIDHY